VIGHEIKLINLSTSWPDTPLALKIQNFARTAPVIRRCQQHQRVQPPDQW